MRRRPSLADETLASATRMAACPLPTTAAGGRSMVGLLAAERARSRVSRARPAGRALSRLPLTSSTTKAVMRSILSGRHPDSRLHRRERRERAGSL